MAEFFASTQPPSDLQEVEEKANTFVEHHKKSGKRIVLITSGGTLVPIEKRTVRHLDNFSTGGRGSKSAEEFLSLGYAVIFMHRDSSLQPYRRILSDPNTFNSLQCNSDGTISVEEPVKGSLVDALTRYKEVRTQNLLLSIPFSDIFQYLFYLRCVSQSLKGMGRLAGIYLAAAVSDFYIHPQHMVEHKIESTASLSIDFEAVPKVLGILTQEWVPEALVISFKLETDEEKLIPKARFALEKYKHQIVIANLLERRNDELCVVRRDAVDNIKLNEEEKSHGIYIEQKLVLYLKEAHSNHLNK